MLNGIGGGNGHQFRASNDRNAAAFLQEQETGAQHARRLPQSRTGKILLALAVIALVAVAALLG